MASRATIPPTFRDGGAGAGAMRAATGKSPGIVAPGRMLRAIAVLLFSMALGSGLPARAARADAVDTDHTHARLVSETAGWTAGRTLRLGLSLDLAPGWHTYWSNPGDAGIAPDATLSLDGGKAVPVGFAYPTPARLPTGPLMGYGYEGRVLLPFTVRTEGLRAGVLRVALHADWLVCATVCVPESADLALTLDQTEVPSPSDAAPLFAATDAAMPRPSPFRTVLAADGTLRVSGEGLDPAAVTGAWFMPKSPGLIDQDAPQTIGRAEGALTLALKPLPDLAHAASLDGVLVLRDRAGQQTALAVEAAKDFAAASRPAAPGAAPRPAQHQGLARLLVLGLLGGLVLNLMPCVFPILAMKAASLGRHGGARAGMRRSALLYTAGVVASFLAIGAVAIALRGAGSEAGWGFQFQSPAFVAAIAWLLFGVGLSFLGVIEIGAGLGGVGQGLAARGGAFGDVMTGVLAVVVATPCTAPFMGVAIAGALAGPALAGLAIFVSLGLGLALPYLLLGLVPALAARVPRPGVWMLVLRQALAFPVLASVVWLVWVLAIEAGPDGVVLAGSGLLLVGTAAWLLSLVQRGTVARRAPRRVVGGLAAVAVLVAVALLPRLHVAGAATGGGPPPGTSAFSTARLAALRAEGRPVLVDMSAAWCVTCLVNERVALDPLPVRSALDQRGVVLLRGDWTRRDPDITAFLARFGRDGVPLYVFFPRAGAPRILPQILTQAEVLRAIGVSS